MSIQKTQSFSPLLFIFGDLKSAAAITSNQQILRSYVYTYSFRMTIEAVFSQAQRMFVTRNLFSLEAALAYKTKLENDNPGKKVVLFSVRFWAENQNEYIPDAMGKINMAGYNHKGQGGVIGVYDYGLYDAGRGGKFWHANGGEDENGPMEVYLSTYSEFIKPNNSYNRKVFAVQIAE